MDSSPDLSLKLRRGSSDSRDTFYMDFAQGIDSDIEEVDNSGNARAPQQPPTPPLPLPAADEAAALVAPPPPAPLALLPLQPLPTLNESDDLPPTPPPAHPHHAGVDIGSPPASPATSVLEMIPPPPMSPPPPPLAQAATRGGIALPPSPPAETEDEGDDDGDDDDGDDGDDERPAAGDGNEDDEDDDDDDDKSTPPPPLPPLPSNLSYVHGNGAHGAAMSAASISPPLTRSPSTSPSPPATPLPGAKASPPHHHHHAPPPQQAQQAPPTPPSESDQSQPNSPPPPLPQHGARLAGSPPPPPEQSDRIDDIGPSTPPPEFGEPGDMIAAALAAAVEATSLDAIHAYPMGGVGGDENRSYNEDESTTITTPPSNGYSGSSILAPPADQLGDLEDDVGIDLADIPPPAGMEDDIDDDAADEDGEEADEPEDSGEKTPLSEQQADEVVTEEHTTADTPADEEVEGGGTPTPQATPIATPTPTPTVSGSPKRRDSGAASSRGPSRSVSRSGSASSRSVASRSGSVRGSKGGGGGSRAGSIAAASVASAAASIASAAAAANGGVPSPQASIKSIRSPPSIKSTHSTHSTLSRRSIPPQAPASLKSPPEGDSAPAMPSPPLMRSPPPAIKSPPPQMHSPPRVTSPPRVYSPPQMSSPPLRKADADPDKPPSPPEKGTGSGSLPSSTSTAAAAAGGAAPSSSPPSDDSSKAVVAGAVAVGAAAASLSYQDEHAVRPHLTSHHHYHLPHQFQHPHHQNHHTHSHGSVPVPTPTVPAAYAAAHLLHEVRHIRAPSNGAATAAAAVTVVSAAAAGDTIARPSASPHLLAAAASETASHASVSPGRSSGRLRDSGSHHRVTIDESSFPQRVSLSITGGGDGGDGGDGDAGTGADRSGPPSPSSGGDGGGGGGGTSASVDERQTGHLALMYHSHQLTSYPVLPAIRRTHRPSFVYPPMPRVKAGDALATLFSALYGKLLVVMGIAFPMAEVISTYIPPSFYEVYYLYLYIGSMIFLLFMYATLLWGRPKIPNMPSPTKSSVKHRSASGTSESMDETDTDSTTKHQIPPVMPVRRPSLLSPLGRQHHYGSFYLRMGAVAFGIGSMIYSGLEFGQYFELNPDTKCHNVLLALTPATRMAFIFIQMYFIFLNNEQIKVYRYKIIARFGLMHMIGTNLAVWLNVLIQETKHEILTFYNPENRTLRISHRIPTHSRGHAVIAAPDPGAHLRVPRGLKGPYQIFECRRTNILGTLVQDASPFLFPCTIEYSLICAAILYVMWRSISRPQTPTPQRPDTITSPMKRSPHHYSVDCARAHKGLFVGILILVLTIISLILFFVLISRPDFVALAVTEVTICELLIYGTATIATLLGMFQIRHLQYDAYRSFSLDDILLVGAQTGSFLYNIFTVIAGHFTLRSDDMLVPINALASIVQTACQTMFILDASRRQAVSPEHIRKKPGREIVTFMLVVNLAMWAISTLEKSRAESHPIQLNFYGLWAWTIITHVSMPLAIFYRFHSTVCLCEIWKRAYKLKPTYM